MNTVHAAECWHFLAPAVPDRDGFAIFGIHFADICALKQSGLPYPKYAPRIGGFSELFYRHATTR